MASGDPLTDRVLLWTRVSGSAADRVPVRWQVARDPGMQEVVSEGEATTGPERDYTFKATASGLKPGMTYHYRFEALGERSPVGRTKTLPRDPQHVRLAFVSCSNLPFGYFNVYRRVAERDDLDAVLHLGDYLYEYPNRDYGDGTRFGRVPQPNKEITTLSDYRTRHAQYKSDPDLQEVHRLHPFVCIWDDHEITNNAYTDGAENHQVAEEEGDWFVRRTAAVKAYFEWMPIREPEPWPSQRTYRTFRFGKLLDLIMLDTRLIGRSRQAERGDVEGMAHPDRTLLGERQERWLYGELAAAKSAGIRWPVLGQQVMMGPMLDADRNPRNPDQWDGYDASRNRLFDFLERERIGNLVVLTGDVHQSWGMDVPRSSVGRLRPGHGRRILRSGLRGHRRVIPKFEAPPAGDRGRHRRRGEGGPGRQPAPEVRGSIPPRLLRAGPQTRPDPERLVLRADRGGKDRRAALGGRDPGGVRDPARGEGGRAGVATGGETQAAQFSRWGLARRSIPAKQPVMKPARPSSPGGGSAGDPSRLTASLRVMKHRAAQFSRAAHRCVSVGIHPGQFSRWGLLPHAPCQPSASPPPGELASLGAHPGSTTGC